MNLPEAFISCTKALLGNEWAAFERALNEESPTSIRINRTKWQATDRLPCSTEPVAWASDGYYLESRPAFTLDPLLHAGCYYVQEASSMYLEQIIQKHISQPAKVLDLCAAPGGKSTQLVSVLPERSLLVANEVIRSRASVLVENLTKWGNPHTIITGNDPAAFAKTPDFFDVIVADVPCSGEGMFRKDPKAIEEWSAGNVQLCAERQRRIIADVWDALKPEGLLIYSTCTYNREENEDNIDWICNELGAEIVEAPLHFYPHQSKGEGFFIAAVRKTNNNSVMAGLTRHPKKTVNHGMADQVRHDKELCNWLFSPEDFTIFSCNNLFTAIPNIHAADYQALKKQLKIIQAGIPLGEQKGKDFIPAHAPAMSTALNRAAFPQWELELPAALKYLRKEAFTTVPADLPKGYVVVTYNGHPLGFIKNIGTRANNLYPSEWRIRRQV